MLPQEFQVVTTPPPLIHASRTGALKGDESSGVGTDTLSSISPTGSSTASANRNSSLNHHVGPNLETATRATTNNGNDPEEYEHVYCQLDPYFVSCQPIYIYVLLCFLSPVLCQGSGVAQSQGGVRHLEACVAFPCHRDHLLWAPFSCIINFFVSCFIITCNWIFRAHAKDLVAYNRTAAVAAVFHPGFGILFFLCPGFKSLVNLKSKNIILLTHFSGHTFVCWKGLTGFQETSDDKKVLELQEPAYSLLPVHIISSSAFLSFGLCRSLHLVCRFVVEECKLHFFSKSGWRWATLRIQTNIHYPLPDDLTQGFTSFL